MIKKDPKAFPKLLLLGFHSRGGAGSALKHQITRDVRDFPVSQDRLCLAVIIDVV